MKKSEDTYLGSDEFFVHSKSLKVCSLPTLFFFAV